MQVQVTIVNGSPNSGIGSVNYSLNGGSYTNGLRNTGNSAPNPMPITDPHDRFLTFVPGAKSRIVTSAPEGLLFPGDPGVGRGIISTDLNNFGPRVGMAWDPLGDRKTAIRAAAGIFYGSMSGKRVELLF